MSSSASPPFRALIGIDGSEDSEDAFRFYAEKIHNPQREALLVYVVKPLTISSNEMAIYVAEIRERSMNEEKIKVKQIKDTYEGQMRTLGIQGKINIIYYSRKPGKMLCELAEQEKCAVIVVGCRRSGTTNLGPTVDYVLRKASVPVVLASGKHRRESLDHVPCILGQFQMLKIPKDSDKRFRRISCPARCVSLDVPEEGAAAEGAAGGGATNGDGQSLLEKGGSGMRREGLQPPPAAARQRRHSVVVNAFMQLGGRARKMIRRESDTSDTTEDPEETMI